MESLLDQLKQKRRDIKESQKANLNFLEAIGYPPEQYKTYSRLEEEFVERIVFEFKKVARVKREEGGNVYIAQVFLDSLFTEEGQKFYQLLDEHISTPTMKYFVLMQTFKEFERKMISPDMIIPVDKDEE